MKKHGKIFAIMVLASMILMNVICVCEAKPEDHNTWDAYSYRIADRSEGMMLMMSNDYYFDGLNQNDLDFRMQKKDASVDEYKAFAADPGDRRGG